MKDRNKYTCQYCEKEFVSLSSHRTHLYLHGLKENRDHECLKCGKRFGTPKDLIKHQRIHSGEKPFCCEKCDYRTAQKSNLTQHLKIKHCD